MDARPDSASGYFGAMGDDYDSLIRRALPNYDEMIHELSAYLPAHSARALELGCGTGNFTLALAGHATFVGSRFEDLDLESNAFDLIGSCISLHNVTDKGRLFRNLREALSPRGALRFADQMLGGSQSSQDHNWER